MTGLVSAASEHGATRGIAEAIARTLRRHGPEVVVLPPQDVIGIVAGVLQKRDLTRPQRAALPLFPGFQGHFRDRAEIQRWAGGRGQSRSPEPELTQLEVQVAYQTAAT